MQLVLKLLHFSGELSGIEIARRLGVEFSVIEPTLDFIKRLHQCEIVGGAGIGGPTFRYRITDSGRQRAMLFLENNQYVGRCPGPAHAVRRVSGGVSQRRPALDYTRTACARRSRISC